MFQISAVLVLLIGAYVVAASEPEQQSAATGRSIRRKRHHHHHHHDNAGNGYENDAGASAGASASASASATSSASASSGSWTQANSGARSSAWGGGGGGGGGGSPLMHNHQQSRIQFEQWHNGGSFTFTKDVGVDACGEKVDFTKDWIVGVGPMYWTTPNPNVDPICQNHCIVLETAKRKQVMLMVHDKCDRCGKEHINVSQIAFKMLGESEVEGHIHGAKWKFVRCDEKSDQMLPEFKAMYHGGPQQQY